MSRIRQERLNSLIETMVAELLLRKCKDPRLSVVTVTKAKVSADLKKVRLFYSVLGTEEERTKARSALEGAKGFIRHRLFEILTVKYVPEVVFEFDQNPDYASRISELLADLGLGGGQAQTEGEKSSENQTKDSDEVKEAVQNDAEPQVFDSLAGSPSAHPVSGLSNASASPDDFSLARRTESD
ncbi:MAG: 30S ribosome-binding factor RbfA [Deltaproteobacteria bacterium]|jgi:ribosome-binding factor A|nr:30S ribosome-binding factor RbfA [Deltaproteobacteria bacterium]